MDFLLVRPWRSGNLYCRLSYKRIVIILPRLRPGPVSNIVDCYQLQFQACGAPSHCEFYGVTFVTRTPAVWRATVAPYYVKRQPDSRKYNFRRLILQLLPNLQTTFVSKWVHDVSRHPQLVSSHQITSENRLVDYTPESSIRSWRRYRRWYFRSVR